MRLEDLGWNEWFREKWRESSLSEESPARVTAVHKDSYTVRDKEREIPAEICGKLQFEAVTSLDLPAVGDWVAVQYFNENTLAIIQSILPRKSLLKRKTAGKRIEFQPIATNIDTAFIVQSADFNFNLRRAERYLAMVLDSRIEPVFLLSKTDLVSREDLNHKISQFSHLNPDCSINAFSSQTGDGLEDLKKRLNPGQTYCLLGSSGVGKTTLINRLIGKDLYATSAVRAKDGRGRHATASRQMVFLERGGMIIDTPGMRELGSIGVEAGIDETFSDIFSLGLKCRYKDCTHTGEPGCFVLEAVNTGELDAKRYQNYLKIRKESRFHEMSYLEKRQRDKAFGKMVKTIKKIKNID